ncbi:MAG: hypothetical protein AVDCRST_MAG59-5123, partial [uncultured Thermomicrobiales bacterium]
GARASRDRCWLAARARRRRGGGSAHGRSGLSPQLPRRGGGGPAGRRRLAPGRRPGARAPAHRRRRP